MYLVLESCFLHANTFFESSDEIFLLLHPIQICRGRGHGVCSPFPATLLTQGEECFDFFLGQVDLPLGLIAALIARSR